MKINHVQQVFGIEDLAPIRRLFDGLKQAIGDTEGALKLRIDEVGKDQHKMREQMGALRDQLAKIEDDLTIIKEYLAASVRSQSCTKAPDESRPSTDGGNSEESAI